MFLWLEETTAIVAKTTHLEDLTVVVGGTEVAFSSIDNHVHSLLDILEGLEGLEQVLGEAGEFVGAGLGDV